MGAVVAVGSATALEEHTLEGPSKVQAVLARHAFPLKAAHTSPSCCTVVVIVAAVVVVAIVDTVDGVVVGVDVTEVGLQSPNVLSRTCLIAAFRWSRVARHAAISVDGNVKAPTKRLQPSLLAAESSLGELYPTAYAACWKVGT